MQRHLPKKISSAVLLLHGLGANGQDLISLGQEWAPRLPETAFFSPDAPEPCDMAPMGYQWFSLRNWTPASITEGLKKAQPGVDKIIDGLLQEYKLPASRFVLAGFSQGAMLSLFTGLQRKEKLAGILAYSGALFPPEAIISKPPVMLIHGTHDDIVPVTGSQLAAQELQKQGLQPELHLIPGLGHGIDGQGLDLGAKFLHRVLQG